MNVCDRSLNLSIAVVTAIVLPTIWLQAGPTEYLLTSIRPYRVCEKNCKEAKVANQEAPMETVDSIQNQQKMPAEEVLSQVPINLPPPPQLWHLPLPPPQLLPHPSPPAWPPSPAPDVVIIAKTNIMQEIDVSTPLALEPSSSGPTFLEALANCTTLECVRAAHELPRGPATFNFPHAMIIGFQKSATTSTHLYLMKQRNVLSPATKEPEFFTYDCAYNPPAGCPADLTRKYLKETLPMEEFLASNGTTLTYEGSTHLVRSGPGVVKGLRQSMPWLKLVVAMREPISRAASMLIHTRTNGKGCLFHKKNLGLCLSQKSQINGGIGYANNYADNIRVWLNEWPAEQMHFIQYEELTKKIKGETLLVELLRFVGLQEAGRFHLRRSNTRRFTVRPKGWPMKRTVYSKLIEMVRPDVDDLLDLLEASGKIENPASWRRRWEMVWQDNLDSCDKNGDCSILLS